MTWRVERELLDFLLEYRSTAEYRNLQDGERLRRRLDEAGFGDLFYAPDRAEWQAMRQSKLPDLASPITQRLALDTLYSLLADGEFVNEQEKMDAVLARRVVG